MLMYAWRQYQSARPSQCSDSPCAADVALKQFTHLCFIGIGVILCNIDSTHHHACCAKSALQAMTFLERSLHRVHRAVGLCQPHNRCDAGVLSLRSEHIARLHGMTVRDHCACATLGGVTAYVRTCEFERLTYCLGNSENDYQQMHPSSMDAFEHFKSEFQIVHMT
jgi:hypothetical protein